MLPLNGITYLMNSLQIPNNSQTLCTSNIINNLNSLASLKIIESLTNTELPSIITNPTPICSSVLKPIFSRDNYPNKEHVSKYNMNNPSISNYIDNIKFKQIVTNEQEHKEIFYKFIREVARLEKLNYKAIKERNKNKRKLIYIHDSFISLKLYLNKKSKIIDPRHPLRKDDDLIDYDKDSEDERLEEVYLILLLYYTLFICFIRMRKILCQVINLKMRKLRMMIVKLKVVRILLYPMAIFLLMRNLNLISKLMDLIRRTIKYQR